MHPGKSQSEHIDEFHKLVGDLSAIDIGISDEDQALLLLTYLPSSFDNFVETLLYGRDTLKLKDQRVKRMMTGTESDIEKFNGKNDFGLWQVRMKALLKQHGLAAALEELPAATSVAYDNVIQKKVFIALILCLGDRVLWEITKETTAAGIQKKLETLYMTKSLANRLYLKRKLYTFHMHPGKSQSEHIDEFHKLVGDLSTIDIGISDEDQALLLLTYLPSSFDNFVETLLYGRDTLKLKDVLTTLNSRELEKMTKAKGDSGEGLYVRGRYGPKDMDQDTYSAWSKS
nr:retrovirus-related Pol polyprotein from transposon TNT 1-94 [Tanacetum cinerariifolium]